MAMLHPLNRRDNKRNEAMGKTHNLITCGYATLQRNFESLAGHTDNIDSAIETADGGVRAAVD